MRRAGCGWRQYLFGGDFYYNIVIMLWIKSLHIISVIFWAAGLMYLPRLFVYHAECVADEIGRRRFCLMESRLYWRIMTPAMVAALLFGVMLIKHYGVGGWLALKILLVLALAVFHGYCGVVIWRFRRDETPHSARFFRIFNEIPALLIIGIVLLVVQKGALV